MLTPSQSCCAVDLELEHEYPSIPSLQRLALLQQGSCLHHRLTTIVTTTTTITNPKVHRTKNFNGLRSSFVHAEDAEESRVSKKICVVSCETENPLQIKSQHDVLTQPDTHTHKKKQEHVCLKNMTL